jgi:ankyrin repeat protein
MSRTSINAVVTEKQDEIAGRGTYQKEYAGYTPLMLACASSFDSIKCVKLLLRNQADHTCQDAQENTLLHVAAMNDNNTVLHHLVSYVKLDLFARNKNGETALNICQQKKNADGIKILEKASSQ